jgi:hypothetical protein
MVNEASGVSVPGKLGVKPGVEPKTNITAAKTIAESAATVP